MANCCSHLLLWCVVILMGVCCVSGLVMGAVVAGCGSVCDLEMGVFAVQLRVQMWSSCSAVLSAFDFNAAMSWLRCW